MLLRLHATYTATGYVVPCSAQILIRAKDMMLLVRRIAADMCLAAEDMKGFSGPETAGVRIEQAYVKSKFDTVILGFANETDKLKFVKTVSVELQKASEPVRTWGALLVCKIQWGLHPVPGLQTCFYSLSWDWEEWWNCL